MRFFCIASLFLCLFACKSIDDSNKRSPLGVLSTRFFHPRGVVVDSMSTLEAIRKLQPKRIDWTYCEDKKILEIYKKFNLDFSLAVNPQLPDSSGYTTKKYRIIDFEGNPYRAPWMKTWKIRNPFWGCVNNPKFYKLFLKQGKKLAALGAYAILVDDAIFNYRLVKEKKLGCFCSHCIQKFKKQISFNQEKPIEALSKTLRNEASKRKKNKVSPLAREYEKFQKASVIYFLKKWQSELRTSHPKIVFLTNNYNGSWNEIYQVFDGGVAELKVEHLNNRDLDSLYSLADSLDKSQLFTIASENPIHHYKLMEYAIKNKREFIYPWDIMIPHKNRRYYLNLDTLVKKEKQLLKKH